MTKKEKEMIAFIISEMDYHISQRRDDVLRFNKSNDHLTAGYCKVFSDTLERLQDKLKSL